MLTSNYSEWNARPISVKKNGGSHYYLPNSEMGWETDFDSKFLDNFLRNPTNTSRGFRLQPEISKKGAWITSTEIDHLSNAGRSPSKLELSNKWLVKHRNEHRGKWVVLNGDILIGVGDDPTDLVAQARNEGVAIPFVTFIEKSSEPIWMGWL